MTYLGRNSSESYWFMFYFMNVVLSFVNYAIFCELCYRMWFEVNCAKSHHCVIPEGLSTEKNCFKTNNYNRIFFKLIKCHIIVSVSSFSVEHMANKTTFNSVTKKNNLKSWSANKMKASIELSQPENNIVLNKASVWTQCLTKSISHV